MATFKLDPPPSTNDIGEMRNYLNDMYEQLAFVLSNIDSDNITDDFLSAIGQKEVKNNGLYIQGLWNGRC